MLMPIMSILKTEQTHPVSSYESKKRPKVIENIRKRSISTIFMFLNERKASINEIFPFNYQAVCPDDPGPDYPMAGGSPASPDKRLGVIVGEDADV
jgi:hypothetical protein